MNQSILLFPYLYPTLTWTLYHQDDNTEEPAFKSEKLFEIVIDLTAIRPVVDMNFNNLPDSF